MEDLQAFYEDLELQSCKPATIDKVKVSQNSLYKRLSSIERNDKVYVSDMIASGGQKKIFKGELETGQLVAVATIHESECVWSAEKLCKEAYIAKRLCHPHILPVYDYGIDANFGPYMAMPYIDGQTLAELNIEELSFKSLIDIFTQVCQALSFAHSRDVFHGDIKAENMIVGKDNYTYLLDWGAAYALPCMTEELSLNPLMLCESKCDYVWRTVGTLPPEIKSSKGVSETTDIYQFGIMLNSILKRLPDSLVKRCLESISRKCCYSKTENRFTSIREILNRLEEIPQRKDSLMKINFALGLSAIFLIGFFCNFLFIDFEKQDNNQKLATVEPVSLVQESQSDEISLLSRGANETETSSLLLSSNNIDISKLELIKEK